MKEKITRVFRTYGGLVLLGAAGIPIGAVVGVIETFFGRGLLLVSRIREQHPLYFIPFLALAGIFIAYCYMKFGVKSSKGMNLVFEVGRGEENIIPKRLIPFSILGTWLSNLFGASTGREGVAMQIGATFSHWVGRRLPFRDASEIFLVTGLAAGFAGLFQTPIAAVVFAMGIMTAGVLEYEALIPAFTASYTACEVSKALGLKNAAFTLSVDHTMNVSVFWKMILLGVIFGIVGAAFAWCLKMTKQVMADKIKNPIIRIAVVGVVISICMLILYQGRYSGTGSNLITNSFTRGKIYSYDWLFKFILTVISLAAGFQGGEVTPLFAIGSSLGVVLAGIFHMPVELVAAMGYVSVFAAGTNTFFAPVLIGAEIFGFQYLPHFFVVCTIAYAFNLNKSIYTLQRINSGGK